MHKYILIIAFSMFCNLALGADGLSTYEETLVHIPSAKVNNYLYSNVALNPVNGILLKIQLAGERREI